jgi:hypothetical protein
MADAANAPELIVQEREGTHGPYALQASFAQNLKKAFRGTPGYDRLNDGESESLDMIAVKISRILHGNPHEPDHWNDIAGYCRLAVNPEV